MRIRHGTPADLAGYRDLTIRAFRSAYQEQEDAGEIDRHVNLHFTVEKLAAELADAEGCVLLAFEGETPAGYALLQFSAAPDCVAARRPLCVARFYLDRPFIGSGRGHELMEATLAEARRRGADALWLTVWDQNFRALAFYRRCGFEQAGTMPFQFGEKTEIDPVLVKFIAQST